MSGDPRRPRRRLWPLCTHGKPTFVYNYLSLDRPTIFGADPLPAGNVRLDVDFNYHGAPGEIGKAATVTMKVNGTEVATATGDAVLGHPYNSVAWLASKLAQFDERICAGDYIMTGSFTRQLPLNRGDRIEAVFDGIGAVAASIV